ncbi:ABC transporter substrate-binding protein [Listeria monocytogenes]
MKIRKIAIAALSVVVAGSLLTACGGGNSKSDDNGKTKVTFWAAPNPTQVKYWDEMAKAYEKENPDVTIEVSQMKESPSSEATIQSAIASKTAPTMSENINRSFAAQLADSKAIVPLNDVKGLDDVVKERNMSETMDSWKFSDGNQYVLPVYSNPILFAWRLDTLKELGYDAASKGNAFVEDGKLVADDKAGTELLTFMSELQKNKLLLASKATDPFETGTSIMADNGPWTFPNWDEKFPELKYNENYAITAPLVPDNMANEENVATYADSKGVVMYAQATDKEKEAAMDFLKFVYNDDKNDLKFLETTNLIPARDDATENETFTAFFKENPELEVYAANVPYSIPAMDDAKYNDIQQIIGEEAWNPIVRGEKKPAKAWSDMKKAEDGVLQE